MDEATAALLVEARNELHLLRAGVAPLRNRAKDAVAAIDRSDARMEALIDRIDVALNGSPRPKEAQGHDDTQAEDRDEVTVDESQRRWPTPRGVAEWS